MSSAAPFVPYRARGPAPRVSRLGALGCCDCSAPAIAGAGACQACGAGLGALGSSSAAIAVPARWQVDPTALRSLIAAVKKTQATGAAPSAATLKAVKAPAPPPAVAQAIARARGARRFAGLGALGLSPTSGSVVSKVGGGAATAAASSTWAAAEFGSLAGPIGIAAGIVIALAVTLFTKQYFNVGASDAACKQLETLWQQYTSLQGSVAGRALGFSTMNHLMHAAVGAGLFPGNNFHLTFHEGTLACAGNGTWVDSFTGSTNQGAPAPCGAHNCLPDAFKVWAANRSSVPAGTADAVYLVDSILLPMNAPGKAAIPWVYNGAQNPQVHELLYDLADAYIAAHSTNSTPYVEYPDSQIASSATPGAVGLAPASSSQATSPAAASSSTVPYQSASSSTAAAPLTVTGTTAAGTPVVPPDQTQALISALLAQGQSQQQAYSAAMASLQANGVNTSTPAVQSQVQGALAAASTSGVSGSGMLWVGLGLLGVLGVMMYTGKGKRAEG
jgi:hypothetical protein